MNVRRFIAAVLLLAGVAGAEEKAAWDFKFSGYYKNLPQQLQFRLGDTYFDDLNRVRLQFDAASSLFQARIVYDLEAHFGDYVNSSPFAIQQLIQPQPFWDAQGTICKGEDNFITQSLYRAYVRFSLPVADITVGKQVIDWGPGRAWNPSNPFFYYNPLFIEKDERPGADALNVNVPLGSLSSISLVAAGQKDAGQPALAARYRVNLAGTDLGFLAYDDVAGYRAGFDFSRTVRKAEIHGAAVLSGGGGNTAAGILGADYTFANTLKLGVEYYHNGAGSSGEYDWTRLIHAQLPFLAKDYTFFGVDYEITPLLRFQHCQIFNLNDGGIYINPVLRYSLTANTELQAGWVGFRANPGDEFFLYPNVWYAQFQVFF